MRPAAAFEPGSTQALDQSELHVRFARSSLEKRTNYVRFYVMDFFGKENVLVMRIK